MLVKLNRIYYIGSWYIIGKTYHKFNVVGMLIEKNNNKLSVFSMFISVKL